MKRMRSDQRLWLALVLVLTAVLAVALLASGCGGDEETGTAVAQSDLFAGLLPRPPRIPVSSTI